MKEMVGGCCVCADENGWSTNPLVYCDGPGCEVAVHQGEFAFLPYFHRPLTRLAPTPFSPPLVMIKLIKLERAPLSLAAFFKICFVYMLRQESASLVLIHYDHLYFSVPPRKFLLLIYRRRFFSNPIWKKILILLGTLLLDSYSFLH